MRQNDGNYERTKLIEIENDRKWMEVENQINVIGK